MASPHVAGLLAYLLSIYPSETFAPSIDSIVPPALESSKKQAISLLDMYELTYEFVPVWLASVLPSPSLFSSIREVAPIPPLPTLTPLQLKNALIALSSEDKLVGQALPVGTPNLLVFNNATDAKGKPWTFRSEFWANL